MIQRTRIGAVAAALLAAVAILAVGVAPVSAESGPTATVSKKKCGKKGKGKKSASAAKKKKCGKKGKDSGGPELPLGEYACASAGYIASGMQILSDHVYTVNRQDPGTYSYDPATQVVTFIGGSFGSFYGVFDPVNIAVDVYAAYNDPPIQYGDYYGQCGWLSGP